MAPPVLLNLFITATLGQVPSGDGDAPPEAGLTDGPACFEPRDSYVLTDSTEQADPLSARLNVLWGSGRPDRTAAIVEALLQEKALERGVPISDLTIVVAGHGGNVREVEEFLSSGARVIAVDPGGHEKFRWLLNNYTHRSPLKLRKGTVESLGPIGDLVIWNHPFHQSQSRGMYLTDDAMIAPLRAGGILIIQTDMNFAHPFSEGYLASRFEPLLLTSVDKGNHLLPSHLIMYGTSTLFIGRDRTPISAPVSEPANDHLTPIASDEADPDRQRLTMAIKRALVAGGFDYVGEASADQLEFRDPQGSPVLVRWVTPDNQREEDRFAQMRAVTLDSGLTELPVAMTYVNGSPLMATFQKPDGSLWLMRPRPMVKTLEVDRSDEPFSREADQEHVLAAMEQFLREKLGDEEANRLMQGPYETEKHKLVLRLADEEWDSDSRESKIAPDAAHRLQLMRPEVSFSPMRALVYRKDQTGLTHWAALMERAESDPDGVTFEVLWVDEASLVQIDDGKTDLPPPSGRGGGTDEVDPAARTRVYTPTEALPVPPSWEKELNVDAVLPETRAYRPGEGPDGFESASISGPGHDELDVPTNPLIELPVERLSLLGRVLKKVMGLLGFAEEETLPTVEDRLPEEEGPVNVEPILDPDQVRVDFRRVQGKAPGVLPSTPGQGHVQPPAWEKGVTFGPSTLKQRRRPTPDARRKRSPQPEIFEDDPTVQEPLSKKKKGGPGSQGGPSCGPTGGSGPVSGGSGQGFKALPFEIGAGVETSLGISEVPQVFLLPATEPFPFVFPGGDAFYPLENLERNPLRPFGEPAPLLLRSGTMVLGR